MTRDPAASSSDVRTAAEDLSRACTSRRCAATLRSSFNRVTRQPIPPDMIELLGKLE